MDSANVDLNVLKWEIQKQKEYIDLLKQDIAGLTKDKAALKKYLKEEKMLVTDYIRQGLRDVDNGDFWVHYLVFPVTGIPVSLNIKDVKSLVEEIMDPLLQNGEYEGYKIERIDYSGRKQTWHIQVCKIIDTLTVKE